MALRGGGPGSWGRDSAWWLECAVGVQALAWAEQATEQAFQAVETA